MFSCGNDGSIIAWGSGGAVHDQVNVGITYNSYGRGRIVVEIH
jgi:hypothetical protein